MTDDVKPSETLCKHCVAGVPRHQHPQGDWAHTFDRPDPLPDNPSHCIAWCEPCTAPPVPAWNGVTTGLDSTSAPVPAGAERESVRDAFVRLTGKEPASRPIINWKGEEVPPSAQPPSPSPGAREWLEQQQFDESVIRMDLLDKEGEPFFLVHVMTQYALAVTQPIVAEKVLAEGALANAKRAAAELEHDLRKRDEQWQLKCDKRDERIAELERILRGRQEDIAESVRQETLEECRPFMRHTDCLAENGGDCNCGLAAALRAMGKEHEDGA